MKIKTFFIFFSIISLFLVSLYSYFNYQEHYTLLTQNYQKEIQHNANEVRYNISSVMDEIMYKYNSNQKLHEKLYFESINKLELNEKLTIEEIKKDLELQYKDRIFNFYIINKDMIINHSTYKSDIGLDFKNIPAVLPILNSVFQREIPIHISKIILEDFSANYIQYYLHRPQGKDYMIQMGVVFDKEKILNKYYKKLENISTLLNYSIYNLYIDGDGSEFINKLALEHDFESKTQILKNRDQTIKFQSLYEKVIEKPMPQKIKEIEQNLQKKYTKNYSLDFIEKTNDKTYQTILLPISNYQIFQDFGTIYQYLVIKFDVTHIHKRIWEFQKRHITFNVINLLIISLILFIVYRKILYPLYILEKNMYKQSPVSNNETYDQNNELGSIIQTYNKLLNNLHNEIEKNQFLLKENKQFIADTVHQIRTPLTNIMMNGDMIRLYKEDETLSSFIDQINASINMLNNSYEDLSYITTYDSLEYVPSTLSVSENLKSRIQFFNTISKVNKKEIIATIDSNIDFSINQIELERLIDNNISNSIKYADINKPITIILEKKDNSIKLIFQTYGKPIKNKSKLFEKNYREDNAKRGLGLGLYMVKNICDKYNITYDVSYDGMQNIFTYTILK